MSQESEEHMYDYQPVSVLDEIDYARRNPDYGYSIGLFDVPYEGMFQTISTFSEMDRSMPLFNPMGDDWAGVGLGANRKGEKKYKLLNATLKLDFSLFEPGNIRRKITYEGCSKCTSSFYNCFRCSKCGCSDSIELFKVPITIEDSLHGVRTALLFNDKFVELVSLNTEFMQKHVIEPHGLMRWFDEDLDNVELFKESFEKFFKDNRFIVAFAQKEPNPKYRNGYELTVRLVKLAQGYNNTSPRRDGIEHIREIDVGSTSGKITKKKTKKKSKKSKKTKADKEIKDERSGVEIGNLIVDMEDDL